MSTDTLEQIANHLQFLGYEVTAEANMTRATHPTRFNFFMRPYAGGILFTTIFGCSENAKQDRLGYLDILNSLNNGAAVARFYADKDSDLLIEAWHPEYYERVQFGAFIEAWDRDIRSAAESGVKEYLR